MQVLVMYFSRTGHTKQLAEAVAQGVQEVEQVKCLLKPIAEVTKEDFASSDESSSAPPFISAEWQRK